MSSIIDTAFQSLFYGEGSWFGLLLMMALLIGLATKIKYAGALCLPVCVFMFLNYNTYTLPWHGIIILLTGIYSIFMTGIQIKNRGGD